MQIKLLAVFAFVLCVLVYLLTRITMITAQSGNSYARQVLSQQSYDSQTIPYRRGEILDRNGIILAKSDRVYSLILDCREVNSDADNINPTIDALVEVFELDAIRLRDIITNEKTAQSQYQVLKRKVSEEERSVWLEYKNEIPDENLSEEAQNEFLSQRRHITGVWFEEHYTRSYPYGRLASNVIGFSNDEDTGVVGIENYYNNLLNGTNGRIFGYLNQDSEYQKTTIDPEHGKTLVSTIDMNIQEILQSHIDAFEETYGTEESRGKGAANIGVVVMDPNSGEILGMATNSAFDLNNPQDMGKLYTGAEIKAMSDEDYVDALNTMWRNFCVSDSFEPGSVVKPVTVASALECGATSDGAGFYCDGGEFITDTQINCDNIYGHGQETLEYAIVNSCNDALMQIGMKTGIKRFCAYQRLFGFGSPTGIDLPNETAGVLYNENTMHEVELATCTFGQGFTVSMIQEIAAFSTVINGGYYYQPHIIKQIRNASGQVEKTVEPLVLKEPISSRNSALLRRYLTTAVQKGTGRRSQVPGYLTGGKTGTAEKIDMTTGRRASGKYLVSFIGACPMDDPQVVIYVVVDEPNVYNQADSTYPQTLFREIATEVFPYLGLYPTEEVTEELLLYLGLSYADVVQGGSNSSTKQTFQAFDMYGNLYNGAYINEENVVVAPDGTPIAGAYINNDGNVVDGYGNVIEIFHPIIEVVDPVAENPDIASPPAQVDGDTDTGTVWAGVTDEDLKPDEED